MRNRIFSLALLLLLALSLTAYAAAEELIELFEIEEEEPAGTSQVTAAEPPEMTGITLSERPPLEEILALLPATLMVTYADGTAAAVPVSWACADYEAALSEYIFAPVWPEGISFADTAEIPVFTLTIAEEAIPISDASVKLEYTRASYTGS